MACSVAKYYNSRIILVLPLRLGRYFFYETLVPIYQPSRCHNPSYHRIMHQSINPLGCFSSSRYLYIFVRKRLYLWCLAYLLPTINPFEDPSSGVNQPPPLSLYETISLHRLCLWSRCIAGVLKAVRSHSAVCVCIALLWSRDISCLHAHCFALVPWHYWIYIKENDTFTGQTKNFIILIIKNVKQDYCFRVEVRLGRLKTLHLSIKFRDI
jgi:hypothetical protein